MRSRANWHEWVYCGIEDDTNEDVIDKALNEFFKDPILYFVSTRKESIQINKHEILKR